MKQQTKSAMLDFKHLQQISLEEATQLKGGDIIIIDDHVLKTTP